MSKHEEDSRGRHIGLDNLSTIGATYQCNLCLPPCCADAELAAQTENSSSACLSSRVTKLDGKHIFARIESPGDRIINTGSG